MNLKLSNNPSLQIYSDNEGTVGVSDNFKTKATGLMIYGCPNIDAKGILDNVKEFQKNRNDCRLTTIRVQLPYDSDSNTYTFTGTYDSLVEYAKFNSKSLSGYDSNGDTKTRPSLIGTWHISDYVDSTLLDSLSSTSNGIYDNGEPVLSADYVIDWNRVAVQCVDSTKANYNPAASIVLHSMDVGHSYDNINNFTGKWWVYKDEAGTLSDIGTKFSSVTDITDTDGIVSSDRTKTYSLTDFDSFQYFTGVKTICAKAFKGSTKLTSIVLPNTLEIIGTDAFGGCTELSSIGNNNSLPDTTITVGASAFVGCSKMVVNSMGDNITDIDIDAFSGCSKVAFGKLSESLKTISNGAFNGCSSLTASEIPSSVVFIGADAFKDCSGISSMRIIKADSLTTVLSGAFSGGGYPIYLGSDDSSCMSLKLIEKAKNDENWSTFSDRLSSWFKKDYGDKLAKITSEYDIQDYVLSDGKSMINPSFSYETGTRFETDVAFCNAPSDNGDAIHGSASIGLNGKNGVGLIAKVAGQTTTIAVSSSNYFDSTAHNYTIDLLKSKVTKDNEVLFSDETNPTTESGSPITLFGDSSAAFVGQSWLVRLVKNETTTHDLIPVKRKSDGVVGLFDITAGAFHGVEGYTSDNTIPYVGTEDGMITTEDGSRILL